MRTIGQNSPAGQDLPPFYPKDFPESQATADRFGLGHCVEMGFKTPLFAQAQVDLA